MFGAPARVNRKWLANSNRISRCLEMPASSLVARLRLAILLVCLFAVVYTTTSDEAAIVLPEKLLDAAERKYGPVAKKRLMAWTQLIASGKQGTELEKLKLVNDFFNQIPFVSDIEHWSKEEYWATPSEMLATNGGDCEDFSISKYFTLLAIGVSMDRLRITYVKAMNWGPVNQAHMVLTYYPAPGAIPLVLDNLIPEIKPATGRTDLTPVYSFNGSGLWLAKARGTGQAVAGGSGNISLWRALTARMGKEFQ